MKIDTSLKGNLKAVGQFYLYLFFGLTLSMFVIGTVAIIVASTNR